MLKISWGFHGTLKLVAHAWRKNIFIIKMPLNRNLTEIAPHVCTYFWFTILYKYHGVFGSEQNLNPTKISGFGSTILQENHSVIKVKWIMINISDHFPVKLIEKKGYLSPFLGTYITRSDLRGKSLSVFYLKIGLFAEINNFNYREVQPAYNYSSLLRYPYISVLYKGHL